MNNILVNTFKQELQKDHLQIGLWLSSTTSYMAEIAATSGYDWLLINVLTIFLIYLTVIGLFCHCKIYVI